MSKKETCYDCVFYDLSNHVPGKTQRCGMDCLIYPGDKANQICDEKFIPRQGGIALNNIKKKHKTHLVFKIEDLEKALDENELRVIHALDETVIKHRKKMGKSTEGYIVVNRDEPYADLVQAEILSGERGKQLTQLFASLKTMLDEGICGPPLIKVKVDGKEVELSDELKKQIEDHKAIILPSNHEVVFESAQSKIFWFIFFDAHHKIPQFKVECSLDDALNIINEKGKFYARIYERESGDLLLSDGTDSKEFLTVPFDDIHQRCEHGKAPGDCGPCAVGDPMTHHLSESRLG